MCSSTESRKGEHSVKDVIEQCKQH
jgi:hypothetical protein